MYINLWSNFRGYPEMLFLNLQFFQNIDSFWQNDSQGFYNLSHKTLKIIRPLDNFVNFTKKYSVLINQNSTLASNKMCV